MIYNIPCMIVFGCVGIVIGYFLFSDQDSHDDWWDDA